MAEDDVYRFRRSKPKEAHARREPDAGAAVGDGDAAAHVARSGREHDLTRQFLVARRERAAPSIAVPEAQQRPVALGGALPRRHARNHALDELSRVAFEGRIVLDQ